MRVAFFGAWDPSYPRNRILRRGLEHAGVEVTEVRVRERRVVFRYPALLAKASALRGVDVVLVPEFRHKDVPLARVLAGRRPLVFDPLVSRWERRIALSRPAEGRVGSHSLAGIRSQEGVRPWPIPPARAR